MRPPRPTAPLIPDVADDTAFKIVGLGGVGGIVARYLLVFLASLRVRARLVLIDGDAFEAVNATRMLFSAHGNKAAVVRDDLLEHVQDTAITLAAREEFVTADNIAALIGEGDLVLLCVDNSATRKLVSDFCGRDRRDVCVISGGNDGVEPNPAGEMLRGTYGNVQVFLRRDGRDASPSLTAFHPEIEDPADALPTENCVQMLESVPQILFANLMTASAMLNATWLYLCGALHYSELSFDIHDGLMRPLPIAAPVLPAG